MITKEQLDKIEVVLKEYYKKYPVALTGQDENKNSLEYKRMYDFFPAFKINEETFFNPIGYMMYRKKVMDDVLEFRKQIEAVVKKVKA